MPAQGAPTVVTPTPDRGYPTAATPDRAPRTAGSDAAADPTTAPGGDGTPSPTSKDRTGGTTTDPTASTSTSDTAAEEPVGGRSPYLAFDMPSTATLRASGKHVFAHYMPPLPLSLDNKASTQDYYAKNYLNPTGENGKHKAYGGHLRDRPLPRAPLATSAWRLEDMKTEVRQAVSEGLDGFAIDMMQLSGDPDKRLVENTDLMLRAARAVDPGFKIMLMPDMTSSVGKRSSTELAKAMLTYAKYDSAFRFRDGRLVISPFNAERRSVEWWKNFLSVMKANGEPVAFVPVFLDDQANAKAFASISYGMGNWGSRTPRWNDSSLTYATGPVGRVGKVHDLGKIWMQPVSVQDARPRAGKYWEALNTLNLRETWNVARKSKAEWVQLTTWNDYTETSQLAPTARSGWTFLDISAYYLSWYKTGVKPTILRDTAYVTHRIQPVAAKPRFAQTTLMKWVGGSPSRDKVEALVLLTAAARVKVSVGGVVTTCEAPAGVSTCLAPLRAGTVKVDVVRAGATVATVTSKNKVTNSPYVQDLSYVGASSRR